MYKALLLLQYFQNMIEWEHLTRGYSPNFILGPNILFQGIMNFLNFRNLKKKSNNLDNAWKLLCDMSRMFRAGIRSIGLYYEHQIPRMGEDRVRQVYLDIQNVKRFNIKRNYI